MGKGSQILGIILVSRWALFHFFILYSFVGLDMGGNF